MWKRLCLISLAGMFAIAVVQTPQRSWAEANTLPRQRKINSNLKFIRMRRSNIAGGWCG